MRFRNIGLKAFCLFGALALAACTTSDESETNTGGGGGGASAAPSGQVQQTNQAKAVQEGPAAGSQEDLDLNVGSLVFFDYDQSYCSAPRYPGATIMLDFPRPKVLLSSSRRTDRECHG